MSKMALWILLTCLLGILYTADGSVVRVITNSSIHTVEKEFLSFNIDTMLIRRRWGGLNFSSPRLHNLLRGLSPAYLRIGGSPADWTIFDAPETKLNISKAKPHGMVTLTKSDWDNLVKLTMSTGIELLFDLNLQLRFGVQWDPSNAIQLMEYSVSKGYGKNIHFELGNEPLYGAKGQARPSGWQIGADFKVLREIMNSYPNFKNQKLVGPDIVAIEVSKGAQKLLEEVLDAAQNDLYATTWHHYYFRGDKVNVLAYVNPKYFPVFEKALKLVKGIVSKTKVPHMPIWIGETSDAYASGTPNVSDRFAAGFLWLDKLGLAAKYDTGVVMKQTFYDYNYCLINPQMYPNPDYWLSYLHKQLVSNKVLNAELWASNASPPLSMVKAYAHCTNTASGVYSAGAVTVFALNISPNVTDKLMFLDSLADADVDIYLMSADDLLSKHVKLNGETLLLIDDHILPKLVPTRQASKYGIKLPPYTYGFFVFPSAKAAACT